MRSPTICGVLLGREAVLVRAIGHPHDFVRTDIVGQDRKAAIDRLERDPAVGRATFW